MDIRRWLSGLGVFGVFIVGAVTGGMILRALTHPASLADAQMRALRSLDRPPTVTSIGDNRIVDAVHRIEPTVVNIDTVGRMRPEDESAASAYMDQEVRGKGSGVVVTSDGYIVTNNHVIDGASRIRVTLSDGRWFYAHLVGRDPDNDLAVVRVDASGLPAADLGDSDRLQVGEWAIAVGNPLGLGSTTTVGVISALHRKNLQIDEGRTLDGAIQTDAAINRGNSGGALANVNGQLVGINTAILSSGPNGGSIGLGFAIPTNTVRSIVRDLIADGVSHIKKSRDPWIGITLDPVTPQTQLAFHLSDGRGAEITHVLPETPASMADLRDHDIILSIDKKSVEEVRDVREAVTQHRAGEKISVHILRPMEHRELDVFLTVQERPESVPTLP